MRTLLAILVFGAVSAAAIADEGAIKMNRDELLAFLPETKVTHVSKAGSTRIWSNAREGTLLASSDNKKHGSVMGTGAASSTGTWMVNDEGKYCVHIEWKRESEKWCASILKAADGYYLNSVEPTRKIDFAK